MTIVKKVLPYEFLVRWDEKTGVLKGWHFLSIESVIDDDTGVVYAATPSAAMSPTAALAAGFKLSDILDAVARGALASADEIAALLESARADLETEKLAHAATLASLASLDVETGKVQQ